MTPSIFRLRSLVFLSLLEILIFGGLTIGWSSLVFVLKEDGVFGELCTERKNTSLSVSRETSYQTNHIGNGVHGCFKQDARLNLIFSISTAIINIINVISGQMQYQLGARKARTITIFVYVIGLLFLGFTSANVPWLLLPGLVLVGVAGVSLLISDLQIAISLSTKSAVYVGILNGCFDSSVLTQRVVKVLFENGIGRRYSYSVLAGVVVVISGFATNLFPSKDSVETKETDLKSEKKQDDCNTYSTIGESQKLAINNGINYESNVEIHSGKFSNNEEKPKTQSSLQSLSVSEEFDEDKSNICQVISSRTYVFHVLWLSVVMLRLFYFLGSINTRMEQTLHSKDEVSYFTDVMAYTMMGGFFSSYFSGQFLHWQNNFFSERFKKILPLSLTSGLAVLLCAVAFLRSDSALYGTFIILTVLRSFVFSVNMDFIINSFPQKIMSVLFGLAYTIAGVISLLQYALFVWMKAYHEAEKHVDAVMLGLCVLTFIHPLFLLVDALKKMRTMAE